MNASEAERLNTMGTPNGDNTQAAADSIKVVSSTPSAGPIGVFDSGYGGLTILHEMRSLLPQYDYLYLGDNARAPYGPRYTITCISATTPAPRMGRVRSTWSISLRAKLS